MTSSIRRALAARSCSAVTAPSLGGHAPGHRERVPHAETGRHAARFAGVLGQGWFPPLEVRAGSLVEDEHDRGGGDGPDPEADAHGGRRVHQGSLGQRVEHAEAGEAEQHRESHTAMTTGPTTTSRVTWTFTACLIACA